MQRGKLSLSDEVYNQMLLRISEGVWGVGSKIPSEHELCKMFSVSRVSVRAAIQRLQGQELIETKPGIGSFVGESLASGKRQFRQTDISGDAFLQFFDFRQAIEFKAIDLFVIHATSFDEESVKNALDNMKKCTNNRNDFVQYDYDFHMSIILGSKNTFLYNAIKTVDEVFFHYLSEITRLSPKDNKTRYEEHKVIYESLIQKKPNFIKNTLFQDNAQYYLKFFKTKE